VDNNIYIGKMTHKLAFDVHLVNDKNNDDKNRLVTVELVCPHVEERALSAEEQRQFVQTMRADARGMIRVQGLSIPDECIEEPWVIHIIAWTLTKCEDGYDVMGIYKHLILAPSVFQKLNVPLKFKFTQYGVPSTTYDARPPSYAVLNVFIRPHFLYEMEEDIESVQRRCNKFLKTLDSTIEYNLRKSHHAENSLYGYTDHIYFSKTDVDVWLKEGKSLNICMPASIVSNPFWITHPKSLETIFYNAINCVQYRTQEPITYNMLQSHNDVFFLAIRMFNSIGTASLYTPDPDYSQSPKESECRGNKKVGEQFSNMAFHGALPSEYLFSGDCEDSGNYIVSLFRLFMKQNWKKHSVFDRMKQVLEHYDIYQALLGTRAPHLSQNSTMNGDTDPFFKTEPPQVHFCMVWLLKEKYWDTNWVPIGTADGTGWTPANKIYEESKFLEQAIKNRSCFSTIKKNIHNDFLSVLSMESIPEEGKDDSFYVFAAMLINPSTGEQMRIVNEQKNKSNAVEYNRFLKGPSKGKWSLDTVFNVTQDQKTLDLWRLLVPLAIMDDRPTSSCRTKPFITAPLSIENNAHNPGTMPLMVAAYPCSAKADSSQALAVQGKLKTLERDLKFAEKAAKFAGPLAVLSHHMPITNRVGYLPVEMYYSVGGNSFENKKNTRDKHINHMQVGGRADDGYPTLYDAFRDQNNFSDDEEYTPNEIPTIPFPVDSESEELSDATARETEEEIENDTDWDNSEIEYDPMFFEETSDPDSGYSTYNSYTTTETSDVESRMNINQKLC